MRSCLVHNQFKKHSIWTLNQWTENCLKVSKEIMDKFNVRWAFCATAWKPTRDEILAASSYIQPEEKQRISRYVFQDDAKSSLIGRLMMRKFVHLSTSMPYKEICFSRDDHGKPCLLGAGDLPIKFNVSHQGDFVVLAGNGEKSVGVDVMKIEPPANKNIPEFFRIMTRQFSKHEWKTIYSYSTEMEQVACFYRTWALKESYVKNIGVGITIPLQDISFSIKSKKLVVNKISRDTVLYVKGVLKHNWVFEETLIDDKHTVAVSIPKETNSEYLSPIFHFLTFEELVKEANSLFDTDESFTDDFLKKSIKPF